MPAKWQLRQMQFKRGGYLSKRPPYPIDTSYSYTKPLQPYGFYGPSQYVLIEHLGNLNNGEYRYYLGAAELVKPFSQCRVCLSYFGSQATRKEHGAAFGCFKLLTNAYKDLLSRGVCVVCGDITTHEKWGVPLCGADESDCQELWKFEIAQPSALRLAILRAKVENAEIHIIGSTEAAAASSE